MVEQNAGLNLDKHFDMTVDSSGDVESATGLAELEKDLSTLVWSVVDVELVGEVLSANTTVELESRLRSQVGSDPRVDSVTEISISRNLRAASPAISISVNTIYGSAEFSFDS